MGHEVKSLFGGGVKTPVETKKSIFDTPIEKKIRPVSILGSSLLSGAKIRKRIEVTIEDLKKYNSDLKILAAARQQIISTNVDELNLQFVLEWGSEIQNSHSGILQKTLACVSDINISAAKNRIGQIVDLINSVSLKKPGMFTSKEKHKENLMQKIQDITTAAAFLTSLVPNLFNLKKSVDSINKEIEELDYKIESYIITCSFFAEYEKDNFPTELYVSRLSSLLATKAAFQANKINNQSFSNTLITMIDALQNTVQTEIPLWQTNCINYLTNEDASCSVSFEEQKNKLLQKLKL